MKAPRHIETARLILRQPQMGDAAAIFDRYASDAELTRFLGWPRHRTVRDTEAFLQFSADQWEQWPAGPYLILSRTDRQLLGSTGLGFQTPHEAVTGYVLAKDAWAHGYATEALTAMIDLAPQIAVSRLYALCHPEHRPSQRVLEKCGFTRDAATRWAEFPNLAQGGEQEALCYVLNLETEENRAPGTDKIFTGSIPKLYETYLVPLIFQPYAANLANRLASRSLTSVLEVAAGTGVVTRELASILPERVSVVATDLNQSMLDHASTLPISRAVEWQQADAMQLPFEAATYDAVVCQFGVMFFPDKPKAFSEARRVLRPGGVFIFSVWDRIEENEFADTVTTALESLFPEDPPRFLARTPHGYHDRRTIERDLASGGFTTSPHIITLTARSRARSFQSPAIAYCQGTPLRNEIEARAPSRLNEATDVAAEAVARRFGRQAVDGKIQAHIVTIEK